MSQRTELNPLTGLSPTGGRRVSARARRAGGLGILALALLAGLAPAGAQAATPKGKRISWACALTSNGKMRSVAGPGRCRAGETLLELKAGPVFACVLASTVRNVENPKKCGRRKLLTMPPTSAKIFFCMRRGPGTLRYVPRAKRCRRKEQLVFLLPRPTAHDDTYGTAEDTTLNVAPRGVLANDTNPSGRSLAPVVVSAPAHAASFTLRGDGSFSYRPAPNYSGLDHFTYRVADALAGADTAVASILVSPTNDPPRNTVPGAQGTAEDTALTFSLGGANAIAVSDLDAGAAGVKVTLAGSHGTLTLSGTAGLVFDAGDGTADATMILRGTVAAVNTALAGLRFIPEANYSGAGGVGILTDDQGHTGAGGARSDTDAVVVNIAAVDDAPVNHLPGPQTADPVAGLTFSAVDGNAISTSDADAGASPVRVSLSVGHGKLTLSQLSGLSFTAGDGTADASMTFTGGLSDVNAALEGLAYTPDGAFSGEDTLTITTNDQGATGPGGPLGDTDNVVLTVAHVNRPPVNIVPGPQSTPAGTPKVFSTGTANAISTSDADAGSAPVKITLRVLHGTLTLSGIAGLSFTTGDGTADGSMVFTGSVANVNTALQGLVYTPAAGYDGPDALTLTTDDQGNVGATGAKVDTDTVAITVQHLNVAPVNHVPGAQTIPSGMTLTFSTGAGNAITATDADAGSAAVIVSLSVSHGTLTLSGTAGLGFTLGDGTADAAMTFNGPLANVNAALNGLGYVSTAGYDGPDTLSIITNDQGNTGVGGAKSDSDSVAITVQHVNRAPVNTVPVAQNTPAGTPKVFSTGTGNAISIADADAAGAAVKVSLNVDNGTLSLSGKVGLTFTTGDGSGDPAMVFTGTVTAINQALQGMSYTPTSGFDGIDTLTITTDDQGHTGLGGPKTDTDILSIAVDHVDAPPLNTVPGAQVTPSGTPLVFASANSNAISTADSDANPSPVSITLGVLHGTLTLPSISGLAFTVGDGSGDATMTFTGTLTNVNAALNGLSYVSAAGYEGADTLTLTTNDQGNTGLGGPKSDTDSVTITVQHVNVAPVNTVPGPQDTPANTPITFSSGGANAISTADADAGASPVRITLSVLHGTLTLSQLTGLAFTAGDGTADAAMTFTGTLSNVNAALNGLTYTPASAFTGADTLTLTTNDQGNTGQGGAKADTDTVPIAVQHVNVAPVNTVPGPQSTPAGTARVFSNANANAISTADADAAGSPVEITLDVDHGTLSLSQTTGLLFTTGDGSANATMVFTGTIANVNAALNGLSYAPTGGYEGPDTLTFTTDDQGATGQGGAQSDTATVAITVLHVDVAPVNTVPGAQSTPAGTSKVFSTGTANAISTSDADAGGSPLQITLSVDHGTLTLSQLTGLAFTAGDGSANATMVFTGTIANVNAALNGLTYAPTTGYNGADTLTLTTNDQGNTGVGGPKSDTDAVAISVLQVNAAPINVAPATQSTPAGTNRVFSTAGGNPISTSDADAAGSPLEITLDVNHGTLSLAQLTGLAFITGDGSADATMVFTGSIANVNAALNGLIYAPTAGYEGADTLTFTTDDQGATGSGGPKTDTDTVAITVQHVNLAPVNTVPGAQSTPAGTSRVFSSANVNAISTADADAGGSPVEVTLDVNHGTLTLSQVTGLGFTTGNGSADATMVFTGSIANVNAALNGLTYAPTGGYEGPDTLTFTTDDQGNTGVGGAKSDTATVAITVQHVNAAPVNVVPGAQSTPAGTSRVFSTANSNVISTSDPDAGASPVQITLGVNHGTLTLAGIGGLSFTVGNGVADASLVFTGSIANVNAALNGLTYAPTSGYDGPDTLTFTTNDQGATGLGGAKSDTATVAITVQHLNAAPVNAVPAAQATAVDTPLVFSTGAGNAISTADADAGASAVQITLGVTQGTLTLSGTGGLAFSDGDGTDDPAMTFTGTLADVNAALDGLTYTPTAAFDGADTLTLTTDDQGATGLGGPKTDTDTVAITVTAGP